MAQPKSIWFGAGTVVTGIAVVLVVIVAFAIVQPQSAKRSSIAAAAAPSKTDTMRQSTVEYWGRVLTLLRRLENKPSPSEAAPLFRQVSRELRALPTVEVDLDAVNLTINWAALFDRLATDNDMSTVGQLLVEGFVRGAMGDPLGAANDRKQLDIQRRNELSQLIDESTRVRAI